MAKEFEELLKSIKNNPTVFRGFSKDREQISPGSRVGSISEILKNIELPRKGSTILDLGTGYGYGAVLLNYLGYNVIGIDINKDKLRIGLDYWIKLKVKFGLVDYFSETLKENGLYFMARDSRDLKDFPDGSIDLITSFYISGYMINNNKSAYDEAGRILKNDSKLILTTEGYNLIPKFLNKFIIRLLSHTHQPKDTNYLKTSKINNAFDRFILEYKKV